MQAVSAADTLAPQIAVPIETKLQVQGLGKNYGLVTALEPTDLSVTVGEFVTLLGPSGSGKTTLLQMVAGLTVPTSGRVMLDGRDVTAMPVHKRGIGLVFQHYALFPHMTVGENVAFPLRMRRQSTASTAAAVTQALEMVQLGSFAHRFPRELSGGQQQRVALARCFVYQPSLILMDEPLGALDRKLRDHMQIEIKRLHRETGATIIYVTHDQEEALALSDRVCLMNHARIEQLGTPDEVYARPRTAFAADFVGISNILRGSIGHGDDGTAILATEAGQFRLPPRGSAAEPRIGPAALVIRPEHLTLHGAAENRIGGTVTAVVYVGSETRVVLSIQSGLDVTIRLPPGAVRPVVGDLASAAWDPEAAVVVA